MYEIQEIDHETIRVVHKLKAFTTNEQGKIMNDEVTPEVYYKLINRREIIETILLDIANGKRPLPDQQDCRVLALMLGTPREQWSDTWKDRFKSKPHEVSDELVEGLK